MSGDVNLPLTPFHRCVRMSLELIHVEIEVGVFWGAVCHVYNRFVRGESVSATNRWSFDSGSFFAKLSSGMSWRFLRGVS